MKALTYIEQVKFALLDKPKPEILDSRDAIVRVTLGSICTSDLHIKHGYVPRAVPGITVGHEMVGVVESVGSAVTTVKPGDRVTVNVETFCGECFFCRHGFVNNCTDPNGGWALGCRIDGGQAEFVRVPYADQALNKIPDSVTDEQALPLPEMYGKNLTFKTGGVDGCDCAEILSLIEQDKIDTTPLITHRYKLEDIEEAYHIFENKLDGVIKVAVVP